MDSIATLLVALFFIALAAFMIFRLARNSGGSSDGPTAPGKPRTDYETDPR